MLPHSLRSAVKYTDTDAVVVDTAAVPVVGIVAASAAVLVRPVSVVSVVTASMTAAGGTDSVWS